MNDERLAHQGLALVPVLTNSGGLTMDVYDMNWDELAAYIAMRRFEAGHEPNFPEWQRRLRDFRESGGTLELAHELVDVPHQICAQTAQILMPAIRGAYDRALGNRRKLDQLRAERRWISWCWHRLRFWLKQETVMSRDIPDDSLLRCASL